MRAEMVSVGAPAAVIDDESNVKWLGLLGSFPRLAEQAGLIGSRERLRFAHIDVGGAETNDRADDWRQGRYEPERSAGGLDDRCARRAATTSESRRRWSRVGVL